ncbi:MAG: histidinol-phosphate transaminase, partial [Pseudomonadota bacterium]
MTNLPQPKPGIMSIIPYVPGKSKTGQNAKRVIKLSSNENTLGASPKALEAFALHAEKLFRYPDGNFVELRKAIAEVHNLDYEKIVCGAGSDELIGLIVHAYAGHGDEVLYSQYGFLMYKIYAQGAGAEAIAVPEKDLRADVDAIIASVTPKTKIVFLANPNNPTGSYLTFAELERLHQGLPSHVVLVIDEAYAEYADKSDYSDARKLVESSQNVVMLRTFSKIYGLASLRLGWGYVPSNIADALNRLRGPFSVSGVAQIAGIAAIKDVE